MNMGNEVIFTITGMVLVFLILVLLMMVIRLEGKLFDAKKSSNEGPAQPASPAAAAPRAAAPASSAAPAVQVEQGVPGEVVAAIMAAIYTMGGGKYTLKAVRRGANNWGKAGVSDTTAPF